MPAPGLEYFTALLGGVAIQQHFNGRRSTEQYRILQMKMREYVADVSDKEAKLKSYVQELERNKATIAKLEVETKQYRKELDGFKDLTSSLEQQRVRDGHVAQQLLQEEQAKIATLQQAEEKLQQMQAEKQTLLHQFTTLLQQNDSLDMQLAHKEVEQSTLAHLLLEQQKQNQTLQKKLSQQQAQQQHLTANLHALQQEQQAAASIQQQQNALLRQKLNSMQKRIKLPILAIGSILSLYWYEQQHQQQPQQRTEQLVGHPGLGSGLGGQSGLGLGLGGARVQELQLLEELEGAVASVAADGTQLLSAWEEEDRSLAMAAGGWWGWRVGR